MNEDIRREGGVLSRHAVLIAVVVVGVALALGYLFYPERLDMPVPTPEAPVVTTEEERGDNAREIIADLRASQGEVDYSQAVEYAQAFHEEGRLADSQLLYFFAARGGHAPAALDLAMMYDPNHYSAASSLMDEPDAFQAYKWYRDALEGGIQSAADRLSELRVWAEDAASAGDLQAEQLLLQWDDPQ